MFWCIPALFLFTHVATVPLHCTGTSSQIVKIIKGKSERKEMF